MGELFSWNMLKLACFQPTWNQNYLCKFENFVSFRGIFYFHRKNPFWLSHAAISIFTTLSICYAYFQYWLEKFFQFLIIEINQTNFSIQTFEAESIMLECIFLFHGEKNLIRVFLYCLEKTKDPIIYFFDCRSSSRHKDTSFIYLVSRCLNGTFPRRNYTVLRNLYINPNEKGNK